MVKQPLLNSAAQRDYQSAETACERPGEQHRDPRKWRRGRLAIVMVACSLSIYVVQGWAAQESRELVQLSQATFESLDTVQLPRIAANSNSSLNGTDKLNAVIQSLMLKLKNATEEIQKLKDALAKCKPDKKSSSSSSSSDKESGDESEGSGVLGPKAELEGEQADRYKQYLHDFNNRDAASREVWPWADDTLYYNKLGGETGIQYSHADAAIDSGHAEEYGADRTLSFDDLDKSLSDPTYYQRS